MFKSVFTLEFDLVFIIVDRGGKCRYSRLCTEDGFKKIAHRKKYEPIPICDSLPNFGDYEKG